MTDKLSLELFSGVGGMSLGFKQAGFTPVAAIDSDRITNQYHRLNFPEIPVIDKDIRLLRNEELLGITKRRNIDVIFGGSPCQGFSVAGKQLLGDPRNRLIFEFMRAVRVVQPNYFVLENVKGFLSPKFKPLRDELIEYAGNLGYFTMPVRCYNAADFGVAQNRERVFIIGYKTGYNPPKLPTHSLESLTVWDAIGDLPEVNQYLELIERDWIYWKGEKLTGCLRTNHDGHIQARFALLAHGKRDPISRKTKLDPNGLSPTLKAGTDHFRGGHTSNRPIHPYSPRVITVREGARLQSFPDWFQFHPTKWHGFRQVGNAVPPKLAKAIALTIQK